MLCIYYYLGTAELLYLEFMLGDAKYLLPTGNTVWLISLVQCSLYTHNIQMDKTSWAFCNYNGPNIETVSLYGPDIRNN